MKKESTRSKQKVILTTGLLALVVIVILAITKTSYFVGSLWHLTHSSEVHYYNVKIEIPLGWLPKESQGSLGLYKYYNDEGSIIIFTREKVQATRDPKEVMESMGRSFKGRENYLIDGKKALKVTSILADRRYAIEIFMPEQNLSISYYGTQDSITDFNKIMEGVTIAEGD